MKRSAVFNIFFWSAVSIAVIVTGVSLSMRGGRDLKVGLYGVDQVMHGKSPYDNISDVNRPLFRYAPGMTILQYPFMLKSKMAEFSPVEPLAFEGMLPSIFAWYLAELAAVALSGLILLRLIPSRTKEEGRRNLKISLLLAFPFLLYELANSQNKLIALFFLLTALLLFKEKRNFFSAVYFCLALTVYSPLLVFILYFIIKSRGRFIPSFVAGVFVIFFLVPSAVFGIGFNNYLLGEWFDRAIKPFSAASSYVNYLDMRVSNQSLPGAVGRLLAPGGTDDFRYLVSPELIHLIIRALSAVIVLFSCIAAWKNPKEASQGLLYPVFLMLALLLPQYCIYYTWGWTFVFYFAVLNYAGRAEAPEAGGKSLLMASSALFISTCLVFVPVFKSISLISWATLVLWALMIKILIRQAPRLKKAGAP
ncbi:MAG: glycosyltransferase family 87 protein [Candidatus Omnitrophica bacterium]|nr:glycosyltransferase family 87 protein [Candidatus Omnitrophota bacterium]